MVYWPCLGVNHWIIQLINQSIDQCAFICFCNFYIYFRFYVIYLFSYLIMFARSLSQHFIDRFTFHRTYIFVCKNNGIAISTILKITVTGPAIVRRSHIVTAYAPIEPIPDWRVAAVSGWHTSECVEWTRRQNGQRVKRYSASTPYLAHRHASSS